MPTHPRPPFRAARQPGMAALGRPAWRSRDLWKPQFLSLPPLVPAFLVSCSAGCNAARDCVRQFSEQSFTHTTPPEAASAACCSAQPPRHRRSYNTGVPPKPARPPNELSPAACHATVDSGLPQVSTAAARRRQAGLAHAGWRRVRADGRTGYHVAVPKDLTNAAARVAPTREANSHHTLPPSDRRPTPQRDAPYSHPTTQEGCLQTEARPGSERGGGGVGGCVVRGALHQRNTVLARAEGRPCHCFRKHKQDACKAPGVATRGGAIHQYLVVAPQAHHAPGWAHPPPWLTGAERPPLAPCPWPLQVWDRLQLELSGREISSDLRQVEAAARLHRRPADGTVELPPEAGRWGGQGIAGTAQGSAGRSFGASLPTGRVAGSLAAPAAEPTPALRCPASQSVAQPQHPPQPSTLSSRPYPALCPLPQRPGGRPQAAPAPRPAPQRLSHPGALPLPARGQQPRPQRRQAPRRWQRQPRPAQACALPAGRPGSPLSAPLPAGPGVSSRPGSAS